MKQDSPLSRGCGQRSKEHFLINQEVVANLLPKICAEKQVPIRVESKMTSLKSFQQFESTTMASRNVIG